MSRREDLPGSAPASSRPRTPSACCTPSGWKHNFWPWAFQPESNDSRDYDTGELTNSLPLGRSILERHDVPYFLMHRGDLHAMLADIVPAEVVHLSHRLVGLDHGPTGTVRMQFTNGEAAEADAVIGADGVHSVVREIMLGREQPRYTGRVAYRTVIPTGRLNGAPGRTLRQMVGTGSPHRQLFRQPAT